MSEKVLGFRKKDAIDECGHGCHWKIKKFVPVVSLEEHKEFLDAGKLLKLRVIELELEVKRLKAAARREAKK